MQFLGFFLSKSNKANSDSNRILKPSNRNYEEKGICITPDSSLTINEARKVLGKKIINVDSGAYYIRLTFEDNSFFVIEGFGMKRKEGQLLDTLDTFFKENQIKL